jgi:galactokinase
VLAVTYRPGDFEFPPDAKRYVDGVLAALEDPQPCAGTITSTIPSGAGLSSSTALTTALAFAISGGERPTPELVLRAETLGAGVPGGLMDQTAIIEGREGHAILLDCASGIFDHVPIPDATAFVVIDTGTRRALSDGRYAARRREVEAGEPKRFRHAESEQRRVHDAVEVLGDPDALGAIISESHTSLRDDFEVSSAELDATVERAERQAGCTGARLVGAGFAGCVLAVAHADKARGIADVFERAWVVRAVDGATEV